MWGVLAVPGPHWVCPRSWCVLSQSTLLRLQGNCLRWALDCIHFPWLSCSGSGSQVLHKGTDSVGPAFCAVPRSEQLRQPGAWWAHSPQVCGASYRPPCPSCLVSRVCSGSAVSGVLCVSSGELISGCDPPGRCQPSRIPGKLGKQLGAWSQFGRGCCLWGWFCHFLALDVDRLPLCLWPGEGLVHSQIALLWYQLVLCLWAGPALPYVRAFQGKVLSLSVCLFFPSLSGYPTVCVAISC